ncbi:spermidine synthase [Aminobacter aminovorans]|uniref:Spermidine synthase n=1 Tax=Aminobacter aminovorans TaxID=83263 RepID=A0A380WEL5_AMIAI|nr:spermidine synthase [Aminobacter aminovorans]TCS23920.1 spermidine synthase [Aminobacter aminovorans]SUU87469.1 spermidine synthase [Aminobacter aminovorans]
MIPWLVLDTAKIPGGGQLRLKQRGTEFSIMLGSNELMNSRLSGSEEALAKLACDRIKGRSKPKILIGGLGMGFTLRATLALLGKDARIVVAELVPEVIAWARGPMAELFAGCLDDPRVEVVEGDVGRLIRDGTGAYDAILLDVDNGPEGLSREANDSLYNYAGLYAAKAALKPGGVLTVWSQGPDKSFSRRLHESGFVTDEVKVRASTKGSGARHVVWVAASGGPTAAKGRR